MLFIQLLFMFAFLTTPTLQSPFDAAINPFDDVLSNAAASFLAWLQNWGNLYNIFLIFLLWSFVRAPTPFIDIAKLLLNHATCLCEAWLQHRDRKHKREMVFLRSQHIENLEEQVSFWKAQAERHAASANSREFRMEKIALHHHHNAVQMQDKVDALMLERDQALREAAEYKEKTEYYRKQWDDEVKSVMKAESDGLAQGREAREMILRDFYGAVAERDDFARRNSKLEKMVENLEKTAQEPPPSAESPPEYDNRDLLIQQLHYTVAERDARIQALSPPPQYAHVTITDMVQEGERKHNEAKEAKRLLDLIKTIVVSVYNTDNNIGVAVLNQFIQHNFPVAVFFDVDEDEVKEMFEDARDAYYDANPHIPRPQTPKPEPKQEEDDDENKPNPFASLFGGQQNGNGGNGAGEMGYAIFGRGGPDGRRSFRPIENTSGLDM